MDDDDDEEEEKEEEDDDNHHVHDDGDNNELSYLGPLFSPTRKAHHRSLSLKGKTPSKNSKTTS